MTEMMVSLPRSLKTFELSLNSFWVLERATVLDVFWCTQDSLGIVHKSIFSSRTDRPEKAVDGS